MPRYYFLCLLSIVPSFACAQEAPSSWHITSGYEYSTIARQEQPAWRTAYEQVEYQPMLSTYIHARMEQASRFDLYDNYIEMGIEYRFTEKITGYAIAGGTPEADFLPSKRLVAGGSLVAFKEKNALVLTLDNRYDAYTDTSVFSLNPGIQYYLKTGGWITAKIIQVMEKDNAYTAGWLGRIDRELTPSLRLYGLLAYAPETVAGETVATGSLASGMVYRWENMELRLDYTHDDREKSYLRDAVNVSVRVGF